MQELLNYYAMIRNGYLQQTPCRPNGFESFPSMYSVGANKPKGIDVDRHWQILRTVKPEWRGNLSPRYGSPRITELLQNGTLKPIVFSDVDFAVIDRDAQGHVDQYVVDRATLESLGFIAQYYNELKNPEIHLSEIKGSASGDRCFEIGQDLFHQRLQVLITSGSSFIPTSFAPILTALAMKAPSELTNKDFEKALTNIDDAFYVLIVNPLNDFLQGQPVSAAKDGQGGQNRMKLIYTTIAAFSHSQVSAADEMLRHRSFAEFHADDHLYPGVRAFFETASGLGLETVAITRGNQFPYMKGSGSGIDDLFDRVHSTLISSMRKKAGRDPLHPDKKLRSYSLEIDNMTTEDKVRIMIHETLHKFARRGLDFRCTKDLTEAVAVYLDHCVFLTDSDLDAWGTCPVICVSAIRTPTRHEIDAKFAGVENFSNPIALINPMGRKDPLLGFDEVDVFTTFNPIGSGLGELLADMSLGKPLLSRYSARENPYLKR